MERERGSFLWLFLYLIREPEDASIGLPKNSFGYFLNTLQKILDKLFGQPNSLAPFHLFPLRWVTEDSLTGLLGAYPWVCADRQGWCEWNPMCSVCYNFQFCCPRNEVIPQYWQAVYMFAASYLSATTTCMSEGDNLAVVFAMNMTSFITD